SADELHDALVWLTFLTEQEVQTTPGWREFMMNLAEQKRAAAIDVAGATLWIPAERVSLFHGLWPTVQARPGISAPAGYDRRWSSEDALVEILRGRLEGLGPVTAATLAAPLGLQASTIATALAALETEGFALRGRFTPHAPAEEWCERRLL